LEKASESERKWQRKEGFERLKQKMQKRLKNQRMESRGAQNKEHEVGKEQPNGWKRSRRRESLRPGIEAEMGDEAKEARHCT
jgi:hypothetical protein